MLKSILRSAGRCAVATALLWVAGCARPEIDARQQAEQAMMRDRAAAPIYVLMRGQDRATFEALIGKVVDRARETEGRADIKTLARFEIVRAEGERAHDLARAPADKLLTYFKAYIALLETLRTEDPARCDVFAGTGVFEAPAGDAAAHAWTRFHLATWQAQIAGRDRAALPAAHPPEPSDGRLVAEMMAGQGIPREQVYAYLHHELPRDAATSTRCNATIAYFRALALLPAEKAGVMFGPSS